MTLARCHVHNVCRSTRLEDFYKIVHFPSLASPLKVAQQSQRLLRTLLTKSQLQSSVLMLELSVFFVEGAFSEEDCDSKGERTGGPGDSAVLPQFSVGRSGGRTADSQTGGRVLAGQAHVQATCCSHLDLIMRQSNNSSFIR